MCEHFSSILFIFLQASSDWIGTDDAPLDGFSWRGGSERDTTGILLWSEVFLTDLPSGEKVRGNLFSILPLNKCY